jgi:hypothetical protein
MESGRNVSELPGFHTIDFERDERIALRAGSEAEDGYNEERLEFYG